MPRSQRARGGGSGDGGGEEVKVEDFVKSVLNFGGGGEEESDGGPPQEPAAAATMEYKSKNLDAERRRRDRLNRNILTLRAVVPTITKMSKECTLSDAIDHIKKLQNEVLELQRQLADSPGEAWDKQGAASCSESFVPTESTHYQGQVELIPLGSCKYNLKIFWTKKAGLFTKVKGEQDVVMVELRNLLSSIVEVPSIYSLCSKCRSSSLNQRQIGALKMVYLGRLQSAEEAEAAALIEALKLASNLTGEIKYLYSDCQTVVNKINSVERDRSPIAHQVEEIHRRLKEFPSASVRFHG